MNIIKVIHAHDRKYGNFFYAYLMHNCDLILCEMMCPTFFTQPDNVNVTQYLKFALSRHCPINSKSLDIIYDGKKMFN